ncbi:MAG: peroxiredoxin [Proteobacteria bacterium]|nr:peroxiredoxin [Pseudomonadota bacterium]
MATLQVGDQSPVFTTTSSQGEHFDFHNLIQNHHVIIYFYPKDFTPGCTQEAQDFASAFNEITKLSAKVVGVSKDSATSHNKFRQKLDLPFPLLADESGEICQKFGVWQKKKMFSKVYMGIVRYTFLIARGGTIKKVWAKVRVKNHVRDVLHELEQLAKKTDETPR